MFKESLRRLAGVYCFGGDRCGSSGGPPARNQLEHEPVDQSEELARYKRALDRACNLLWDADQCVSPGKCKWEHAPASGLCAICWREYCLSEE